MKFKASFCDPFQPEMVELGILPREKVIETFKNTDWDSYLKKIQESPEGDLLDSPSLEIENTENKNGLAITAIGRPGDYHFLVFFQRPKTVSGFFGLFKKEDPQFLSELDEQDRETVIGHLKSLINNDLDGLEQAFS